ncbi:MAG TPA: hypothetical protein GX404_03555 [Syntrophomonadaceae bacterium]|nr:hypothetical protein [Syntrophomonadaceae bacterium]
MLTVSDVAHRYQINYQQVHDLVQYGYLPVAKIDRNYKHGMRYLFAESDVENLDVFSHLAEIHELQLRKPDTAQRRSDFRQVLSLMDRYERFLEEIQHYPEKEALEVCFYLFHLNHYAKTYPQQSEALYQLKDQVLKKLYFQNADLISLRYLQGPDKHNIWLCEDCKESAHAAGLSYRKFIQNEDYCPKCTIMSVEKEYYSLIEFRLQVDEFRFAFHLPLRRAAKWLKNIDELPHGIRKTGRYDDRMYLYGRPISRIEERVFTLKMVHTALKAYVETETYDV